MGAASYVGKCRAMSWGIVALVLSLSWHIDSVSATAASENIHWWIFPHSMRLVGVQRLCLLSY